MQENSRSINYWSCRKVHSFLEIFDMGKDFKIIVTVNLILKKIFLSNDWNWLDCYTIMFIHAIYPKFCVILAIWHHKKYESRIKISMDYCRMLLVTKSHHERDEEKAVDKNQAGDIGSVSKPLGLCMFSLVFRMDSMSTFLLKYHLCIWKEDFVIYV